MFHRSLLASGLVTICVSAAACAPAATAFAPSPIPPSPVPSNLSAFRSPQNADFRLPLTVTYGPEWEAQVVINDIDLWYKGNPPKPQAEWWGPSVVLVSGARVLDAAKVADTTIPWPDQGPLQPVPDDLLGYVTSIPGVTVIEEPRAVTIGGIQGSQILIQTPAMHPFLWLDDDTNWHGGGPRGVDAAMRRLMILLEVNGEAVLLEYYDAPEQFDQRLPLVQEVFNSVSFGN